MPTTSNSGDREGHEATRAVVELAIERIHLAAMGDAPWTDALATVARAIGIERAVLYTPEITPALGGLWVIHEAAQKPRELHAVGDQGMDNVPGYRAIFSRMLGDPEDNTPSTLFLAFARETLARTIKLQTENVDRICRHLAIGVRLWFRTRIGMQAAEALARDLSAGLMLVHRDGRIAWSNTRGHAWVREGRLVVSNGQVSSMSGLSQDLPAAIRAACEGKPQLLAASPAEATVEIVAVASASEGERCALLLLRDRCGCRLAAAAMARQFQLTPTETDLAVALWKGILIAEYAAQRSVSMSTVRTQLKALLAKTGSRRQSDLVSLVARMQPLLAPAGPDLPFRSG